MPIYLLFLHLVLHFESIQPNNAKNIFFISLYSPHHASVIFEKLNSPWIIASSQNSRLLFLFYFILFFDNFYKDLTVLGYFLDWQSLVNQDLDIQSEFTKVWPAHSRKYVPSACVWTYYKLGTKTKMVVWPGEDCPMWAEA